MSLSTLMQALQRKYRSPQAVMEALGLDAALLDDGKDEPMSRQRVCRLAGDQGRPTALGGVTASPQTMVNKTTGLDDQGTAGPPSVELRQIAPRRAFAANIHHAPRRRKSWRYCVQVLACFDVAALYSTTRLQSAFPRIAAPRQRSFERPAPRPAPRRSPSEDHGRFPVRLIGPLFSFRFGPLRLTPALRCLLTVPASMDHGTQFNL